MAPVGNPAPACSEKTQPLFSCLDASGKHAWNVRARGDEAEKLFHRAGSLVYRDSSRYYLAGKAAEYKGERNKAIASFERAGSLEPSNVTFPHAQGICLFRSGRHADALRLFENILAGTPEDIVSLAYCCEASLILNRRENAAAYIDSILKSNSHDFFGLTRKAGINGLSEGPEQEERMSLRRIKGRLDNLRKIVNGWKLKNSQMPCENVLTITGHGS